jgi:predicted nucleic acid-binding protein
MCKTPSKVGCKRYITALFGYYLSVSYHESAIGAWVLVPNALKCRISWDVAEIRRKLRPPHGKGLIGDIDTLIAATALERNLTVVTTDTDFQRVSGLKILLMKSL